MEGIQIEVVPKFLYQENYHIPNTPAAKPGYTGAGGIKWDKPYERQMV